MSSVYQRTDRYGVIVTLLVSIGVSLVQMTGFFDPLDDLLVDRLQHRASRSSRDSRLLLVEADETFFATELERLQKLVETLDQLRPQTIAITRQCESADLVRRGAELTPIVFGKGNLETGNLRLAAGEQLVYRRFLLDRHGPDLQQHVAALSGVSARTIRKDARIRFADPLPTIAADRVLAGELVPEVVDGRVLLIGLKPSVDRPGFAVPNARAERISELQLRGQLIRCLIAGDWTTRLPAGQAAFWILLVAAVSTQLFRNVEHRWWFFVQSTLWAAAALIGWVSLESLSIEPPISATLCTTMFAHTIVTRTRYGVLRGLIERRRQQHTDLVTSLGVGRRSRDRIEDAWEQVATAWESLFVPTRMVFMELGPGETHLRVRILRRVGTAELLESRRDVTRLPYRDAVDCKQIVRLEKQSFFEHTFGSVGRQADERFAQFVIPLAACRTLGVLVMEIEASRLEHWSDFENQTLLMAEQTAAFLSDARNNPDQSTRLIRLSTLPEQMIAASISADTDKARSIAELHARTLETASSAIAVFDTFGRINYANAAMLSAMQDRSCSIEDFDALLWLQNILGRDRHDCSELLRRCALLNESETLHCKALPGEILAPLLTIQSLETGKGGKHVDWRRKHLSMELRFPAPMAAASNWEQLFATRQKATIESRAQACLQIEPTRPDAWTDLLSQVEELASLCRDQTRHSLADSPFSCTALSLSELLDDPLKHCRNLAADRGMLLNTHYNRSIPRVDVNPFYLARMLKSQVAAVLANASAGDDFTFTASEQGDFVICELCPTEDEEFAIGQWNKESEKELLSSLPLDLTDGLMRARSLARAWGGELELSGCDQRGVIVVTRFRIQTDCRATVATAPSADTKDVENTPGGLESSTASGSTGGPG